MWLQFITWVVDTLPALVGWPTAHHLAPPPHAQSDRRLALVLVLWVVEMVMMSVTYYLDGADALDEDGRKVAEAL